MTKDDLIFILSWRNIKVTTANTIVQMKLLMGDVNEAELTYLKLYKNCENDVEFKEAVRAVGWFGKTYETVKNYVGIYLKQNHKDPPVYSIIVSNKSQNTLILKILYYYKLKDIIIPPKKYEFNPEQLQVINARRGIVVVESGPGTGKTTTAVEKVQQLASSGVICVSYTNATVNEFIRKLNDIDI